MFKKRRKFRRPRKITIHGRRLVWSKKYRGYVDPEEVKEYIAQMRGPPEATPSMATYGFGELDVLKREKQKKKFRRIHYVIGWLSALF